MPTHSYGTINRVDSTTSYGMGSSDSARILNTLNTSLDNVLVKHNLFP